MGRTVTTIEVVFINDRKHPKRYRFLCTYNVQVGDVVRDLRYKGARMRVARVLNSTQRLQGGYYLKKIIINEINGRVLNRNRPAID